MDSIHANYYPGHRYNPELDGKTRCKHGISSYCSNGDSIAKNALSTLGKVVKSTIIVAGVVFAGFLVVALYAAPPALWVSTVAYALKGRLTMSILCLVGSSVVTPIVYTLGTGLLLSIPPMAALLG